VTGDDLKLYQSQHDTPSAAADRATVLWNNPFVMLYAVFAVVMAAAAPAAQQAPSTAWYEFLVARQRESEGNAEAAIAAYKRAAALDPASSEIHTALAELYARQDRVDDCIASAERALSINPDNLGAHRILGLVYASLSQSRANRRAAGRDYAREALDHLERVRASGSRGPDGTILLAIGRLHLGAGSFDQAIPPLRQLVEQEPQFGEGVALLARAYSGAGKSDEASVLLEDLVKDDPDYLTLLAELYERDDKWDKAADAYGRAAEREPENQQLRARWITALLNSPDPADVARASAMLQKIVEAKPSDAQNLYLLSQSQRRTKDFAGAETSARQIIKNDPQGLLGPYALAQVFEDQRNYRKVVETLAPVVAPFASRADAAPRADVARLFLHLGFAYQQLKELDRAAQALEQGKPYARDTAILFQLASVFESQKKYADAERTFKQVLEKDPANAAALNYLGYMLADRGERLDEAVGYIKRALETEPDNSSYLDSLGWAYFKMNRLDLAEAPLRRASADLTTNSVVQDHWGDLLFKLGRFRDAISAWERALAGDGDSIDKGQIDKKIKTARDKNK
jgi:tetratricopeptide (TPR) repeat protein